MSSAPAGVVLGFAPIDALHEEWEQTLACLTHAQGAAATAAALRSLLAHLERHFGAEEAWMLESGFGAAACHAREHAQVIAVVAEVMRRFDAGDSELAARLVAELPRWFEVHASTMDAALAAHLKLAARPLS
ncbi:MAG: hemerythrin family protein [Burkholderiaceae bacterium]